MLQSGRRTPSCQSLQGCLLSTLPRAGGRLQMPGLPTFKGPHHLAAHWELLEMP